MEMIILLFNLVKGNFIILYDVECHLNSNFPNLNILIKFYWLRNTQLHGEQNKVKILKYKI